MIERIFYECVDVTKPSGGVRRLYRHVEILNRHGFAASILHQSHGFRADWFVSDAPVTAWEPPFELSPRDVLVIPEGHVEVLAATADAPCCRVVIALNWANIYRRLPIGTDWRHYGIRHVIAGSLCEQDFIARTMGLDSVVIASGTNGDLFRPLGPKRLQIAYMPRKNPDVFTIIAGIFRSRWPRWAHVPFVPIDEVSHAGVAALLAESAIFLATSFPEGLARPPLEAMASGCLVVGFAGRGSLEYMDHGRNCFRADDLDVLSAAEFLDEALSQWTDGRAEPMVRAARETAERYSLAREEQAVVDYWRAFRTAHEANDGPCGVPAPTERTIAAPASAAAPASTAAAGGGRP